MNHTSGKGPSCESEKNMQDLTILFSPTKGRTKAMPSPESSHGSSRVPTACKKILEPEETNSKASYEDAKMDSEIEHLIRTMFWEIDDCPPMLTGKITRQVNKKV